MTEPVKKRILLVDEDDGLKRSCSDVLTFAGYRVELASNRAEAYGKLREASFDLVITGMKFPGLDGIGLYLDTLKIYSNMREKFLFMENDPCADDPLAVSPPDEKHLVKPFNIYELLKKVETLTGVNLSAFLMKYRNLGENRRSDKRLCWTEDMRFSEGSRVFRPFTHTMDVSKRGLRIKYMGSPVRPDSVVKVQVKYLKVSSNARVVWSMALSEKESASGLLLSEPVPTSSLFMVTQGRRPFVPPLVSGA
jgi:DNA-binding response OmpR family regulator